MKSIIFILFIFSLGFGLWFLVYRGTDEQRETARSIGFETATKETATIESDTNTASENKPVPIAPSHSTSTTLQPKKTIPKITTTNLPSRIILDDIQFASQAPMKDWSQPYQDFCEESSVLIAAFYAKSIPMPSNTDINEELFRIKKYEEDTFGYYKDTTAKETAQILTDFYKLTDVTLKTDPTADDIKRALASGYTIIVPTAGRMLDGPFYRAPGPLYHMLVLKGYTTDGYFITQDPGTNTKGENFKFKISVVMNAIRDWNNGDVQNGQRVVIIVGKNK